MRTILVGVGSLLLGTLVPVVVTQHPEYQWLAVIGAVICYLGAAALSIPAVRRRVPGASTKDDRDDALRIYLADEMTAGRA